jgi:hypothetical protein
MADNTQSFSKPRPEMGGSGQPLNCTRDHGAAPVCGSTR